MKRSLFSLVLVSALSLLPAVGAADVPGLISYQGYLADTAGNPVTGTVAMTFALYDAVDASSALWAETHPAVTVGGGVFSVVLGSVDPAGNPLAVVDFSGPRWLGITVGADGEMAPRIELAAVPFAFTARHAATAGALTGLCGSGDFLNCYDSPMETMGVGECRAGVRLCNSAGDGFDPCTGYVPPVPEVCDGLDNDCDGAVDNGDPGGGGGCVTGQPGVCADGVQSCQGGALVCAPLTPPAPEVCDGLDNDCDGAVDDGNPGGGGGCATGQLGVCASGVVSCQGGALVCQSTVFPAPEVCDGLDNDCDGVVDEGNPGGGGGCATGQPGVCSAGVLSCQGGGLVCQPAVLPSAEVCDGLDNDCDGVTDEGCP